MDGDNKLTINQTSNKISGIEKDVKPRTIDSKKTKNRYNRMVGGHNRQGHKMKQLIDDIIEKEADLKYALE